MTIASRRSKLTLGIAAVLLVVAANSAHAEDVQPADLGTFGQFQASPDNGRGRYQQFYFLFEHTNLVDDIALMKVLFATNKDDRTGLSIQVTREGRVRVGDEGRFNVFTDAGNIGDSRVLETRKVILDLERASIRQLGSNTLVLNLFLDFRDKDFQGRKRIFLGGRDIQDVDSEFLQRGVFNVSDVLSEYSPEWIQMSPDNGEGRGELFSFIVEDRDGADDITRINIRYARSRNAYYGNLRFLITPSTKEIRVYGSGQDRRGIFGQNESIGSHTAILDLGESTIGIDRLGKRYVVKLKLRFKNTNVGTKNFWGEAFDTDGRTSGEQGLGRYTVSRSRSAPHPMFMLPASAKGPGGSDERSVAPEIFSFWWHDSDGLDDIKNLQVKFAANSGEENERVQVDYNLSSARLVRNSTRYYGTVNLGTSHIVEGDRAILSGRFSDFKKIDNYTARIDIAIAFKAGFAGKWNVYLRGEDYSGNQKAWRRLGRFEVVDGSTPPRGRRVLPFFSTGLSQSFMFEFRDPDGPSDIDWAEVEFRNNRGEEALGDSFLLRYTQFDKTLRLFHGGRLFSGKTGERRWIGLNGVRVDLRKCFALHYKDRLQLFVFIEFDNAYIWGLKDIVLWARDVARLESRRQPFGGFNIPSDR